MYSVWNYINGRQQNLTAVAWLVVRAVNFGQITTGRLIGRFCSFRGRTSGRGSPSFLHSSIVHISYPPHPFLHPLDWARAFYYTFRLSFVSLLHTPIAHTSFAHIRSSTSSLPHSAFSRQSDCAQCLYYTSRFNTTNPPHPFPAQLICTRKLGWYNSHKYLTRAR